MDRNVQVFRTEESLAEVTEVVAGLRERYRNVAIHDKGQRFNTDLLEAIELGFLLDLAEVVVCSARNSQGEPRRAHPRGLPHARRQELMVHTMAYLTGDPQAVSLKTTSGSTGSPSSSRSTSRWKGSTD